MAKFLAKRALIMLSAKIHRNDALVTLGSKAYNKSSKDELKFLSENGQDNEQFSSFYSKGNGFELKWALKDSKDPQLTGQVNLLPVEDAFGSWEGQVYFSDTPEDSRSRNFKIIDFFIDEACVGIFTDDANDQQMYFFDFENQFYPLQLDFEGYLKLMIEARAFFYWQKVILDLQNDKEGPISKLFKKQMPKLFPDFKYDDFQKLYNELKLSK